MAVRACAAALGLLAGTALNPAHSGALDRTGQPVAPLFEPGGYAELSFGRASPSVSGRQVGQVGPIPAGATSGDLTERFTTFGFAIKSDLSRQLSAALIYDQPFGADTDYPIRPYFAAGSQATVDSQALTALLRYRLDNGFGVHGGLRYQTFEADAAIPFIVPPAGPLAGIPYSADTDRDASFGYVVGASFERPDIAARVALTYNSRIRHDIDTREFGGAVGSTTRVETPQSIRLDAQMGIAPGTLLFGSIRWAEWSEFDISPAAYVQATGQPLLSYANDVTTYTLGVGRRLTERLSGAVSVTHEPRFDDFVTNLGPTAGLTSLTLAGTYRLDPVEVTGALSYGVLGDARTPLQGTEVARFEDNDVVALGLRVAYRF